jgi:hypothetical protein
MNRAAWVGVAIGVLLIVGGLAYYQYGVFKTRPPLERVTAPEMEDPEPPAPRIRYPVPDPAPAPAPDADADEPAAPPPEPLPALADSDPPVRASLEELFGVRPVESFLVPRRIIQRLVVTINSLDGAAVPLRLRPTRHVEGVPAVDAVDEDNFIWDPANSVRYQPAVTVLQAADADHITSVYFRYYPLFQEAYAELGYEDRYFNDRLIEIIDHLLVAPRVEGPIHLKRPKVLYEFADRRLESLSWGQKMLIRMGPDQSDAVKAKLREIRTAIVARTQATPLD